MIRRFFIPGADDNGGGLPPALGEVDGLGQDDNNNASAITTKERVTDLSETAPLLGAAGDNTPPPKGDEPPPPAEDADDADGAEDGHAAEDDGGITPESFYGEIEKLTGRTYEVQFPAEIQDHLSPEAFAFRDNVVRENAMLEFEEHIRATNPRAYAYMLHTQQGKPDTEFFAANSNYVLPSADQLQGSIDTQRALYRQDLIAKGNEPDDADALVESAIKNGSLLQKATASHKRISQAEQEDIQRIQRAHEEKVQREQQAVQTTTALLNKTIDNLEGFVVPETERPKLLEYIYSKLEMSPEGKLLLVQELDPDNIHKQVGSMLYQYMKGDLSRLVQKKAQTIAAQSLSKRNKNALKGPAGSPSQSAERRDYVPLTAID